VAGKSKRARLALTAEEQAQIEQLRDSRTAPWREVQRARIFWRYYSGENIAEIARSLKMTRKSIGKWISKALEMGVAAALKDTYHRPRAPVITEEARAWVVHLACSKPKELGYAAEVWSRESLAKHVREHAVEAGHASLSRAAKATVQRILAQQTLRPEKVKYYLERRDPDFEAKMREVLMVYRDVALQNANGKASRR
jgi:transposase